MNTHEDNLAAVDHRPYPLPDEPWTMFQRWHDLLFAHWPVDPELLQDYLPKGVAPDTLDGQAWLGIVPFRMSNIHTRRIPALPWVSAFPELNVRTYVTHEDKPGVVFLSLDAANPLAVFIARRWYHLPYYRALMRCEADGDGIAYASSRPVVGDRAASLVANYAPTGPATPASPGSMDHFFTERYCLYTEHQGKLLRGDIHHKPWPLQPAECELTINTMADIAEVPLPDTPPVLHFARELDVLIWDLKEVD
jgi:hypothetical protein